MLKTKKISNYISKSIDVNILPESKRNFVKKIDDMEDLSAIVRPGFDFWGFED